MVGTISSFIINKCLICSLWGINKVTCRLPIIILIHYYLLGKISFKAFLHLMRNCGLVYPIVKIIKKRITIQNPIKDTSYKDTANGNKNNTSKSNTINKIATR